MTEDANGGPPARPRIVVGLDFGTTFSGFAFAHVSDPENIYTFYDYPTSRGDTPYCKTLTASYYKPLVVDETSVRSDSNRAWKLQSWGYPARSDYEKDIVAHRKSQNMKESPIPTSTSRKPTNSDSSTGVETVLSRLKLCDSKGTSQHGVVPPKAQAASVGVYLTRFKLRLASGSSEASSGAPLPPGLTVVRVITDYLRELGGLILKNLQDKYGNHLRFSSDMVQWCITVPSIWDNSAKATMRECMVSAGLVSVHHQVIVVLEPEAASFHCQRTMCEVVLEAGNKLLVADMGGGTSDIVVQEVVEPKNRSVKEVTVSSGGLCGATYVDNGFMAFLRSKVGELCLSECILKYRNVYGHVMKEWERKKCSFAGGEDAITMILPQKLAAEWERSDEESGHPGREDYEELQISSEEMQSIFDPVVQQNVELIQQQMVKAGGKVRVLVMVGGFSDSPYLLRRMKEVFGRMADVILCPPNPGSAICQGAVALALNPRAVVSRICRRTWGFGLKLPFMEGIDPVETLIVNCDGSQWCLMQFKVLVKKGDVVPMDEAVTTLIYLGFKGQEILAIPFYSCDDGQPHRCVTDKGVDKEGILVMDVSGDMELDMELDRRIEVSLCFEGSSWQMKARAVNFNAEQVQLSG